MDKDKARETKAKKNSTSNKDLKNRRRIKLKPGIRTIDVSAVRRMVIWSIGECERQLENLRSVVDVIDGLTTNDTNKR